MPNSCKSGCKSGDNTSNSINSRGKEQLILGLDYGVKKTGMALGNTLTLTARPFDILPMNNGQPNWDTLLKIIHTWQVAQVVIGLPLNMDGTSSPLAKRASKFARRLAHKLMEQKSAVKIYLHDERLSSREAKDIAWEQGWIKQPQDPIDDISACILLNSYLQNPEYITDVTAYGV